MQTLALCGVTGSATGHPVSLLLENSSASVSMDGGAPSTTLRASAFFLLAKLKPYVNLSRILGLWV